MLPAGLDTASRHSEGVQGGWVGVKRGVWFRVKSGLMVAVFEDGNSTPSWLRTGCGGTSSSVARNEYDAIQYDTTLLPSVNTR